MAEFVNTITESNLPEIMTWLETVLRENKVNPKEFGFAELLVEEIFEQLKSKNRKPDSFTAQVKVRKRFGEISIEMNAEGERSLSLEVFGELSIEDEEYVNLDILNAYKKQLRLYRKKNKNIVIIKLHESETMRTKRTLIGVVNGIMIGLLMNQLLNSSQISWIENNILDSVQTMFLNVLILVAAPQIFFSILSGIMNISSTASFGRIGVKLLTFSLPKLGFYIILGLLIGNQIGGIASVPNLTAAEDVIVSSDYLLRDMIVGIIPENIIMPFGTNNILQMLFVACASGVVLSKAGSWAEGAKNGIEFFNHFLSELMDMIMPFIPLTVTVSMARLMIHTGISAILNYGKIIVASAIGLPLCILLSGFIVGIFFKLSPVIYIKKLVKFIPLPFSLSNSTACMPSVMSFCHKELGMDEKMVEFSIPLGMQLNMDGTGYYVAIVSMVLAHTFGISFDLNFYISFFLAQFLIGLTGMGLIAMPSIYLSFGIPEIAVAMVIGIEPILDMFGTAQSVAGNILSSFFVCHKEKSIDRQTYMHLE